MFNHPANVSPAVTWLVIVTALLFGLISEGQAQGASQAEAQTPSSFQTQEQTLNRENPSKGTLIIVGGGDTPYAVQEKFVALSEWEGKAKIAIFTMASTQFDEEAAEVSDEFRLLGADVDIINLNREEADSENVATQVSSYTGYWFIGGDQNRLSNVLQGTRALFAIEKRYRAGAVVGGTSAGAAVMTQTMLTGESRSDSSEQEKRPNMVALRSTEVAQGFGLLPGAIVDQHFTRRSRHNRLVSAVLDYPLLVGVGIDEETALVVKPDGLWEVMGNGHVKIYDARLARITHEEYESVGAAGIRLHVLPNHATFDPKTGRVQLAGGKASLGSPQQGSP